MIEGRHVRFAVVGCGHIGKRHAEMISRNEESELVAMCDIKPAGDVDVEKFGVPFFNSMEELLASDSQIDVISICTPNGLHEEQALKALAANAHIVCEKPMALTKAGCESIIFKALQMSRQVFCVMQNRYSPPSGWIKDVMDHKRLGDIHMVQLNCYWNRD